MHIPGILEKWKQKSSESKASPTVEESSLDRFRDGLVVALLQQQLFPLEMPQAAKSLWTAVRAHQLPPPACVHPQNLECSCGHIFERTTPEWSCGHARYIGEHIGNPTAQLFDICSPPSPTIVYYRVCPSCGHVKRATSLEGGAFNFDDNTVLSVPLLVHMRNLLHCGSPLTNITASWRLTLEALVEHSAPTLLDSKLVAQAYLAFEALTDHGELTTTCALCKDDPMILIFDGNAKLVFKILGTNRSRIQHLPSQIF